MVVVIVVEEAKVVWVQEVQDCRLATVVPHHQYLDLLDSEQLQEQMRMQTQNVPPLVEHSDIWARIEYCLIDAGFVRVGSIEQLHRDHVGMKKILSFSLQFAVS